MADTRQPVSRADIEGLEAEWFLQQGKKISSIEIIADDNGNWRIGEATRAAFPYYSDMARKAEAELGSKYSLKA